MHLNVIFKAIRRIVKIYIGSTYSMHLNVIFKAIRRIVSKNGWKFLLFANKLTLPCNQNVTLLKFIASYLSKVCSC